MPCSPSTSPIDDWAATTPRNPAVAAVDVAAADESLPVSIVFYLKAVEFIVYNEDNKDAGKIKGAIEKSGSGNGIRRSGLFSETFARRRIFFNLLEVISKITKRLLVFLCVLCAPCVNFCFHAKRAKNAKFI
jgi:hypothetical protein